MASWQAGLAAFIVRRRFKPAPGDVRAARDALREEHAAAGDSAARFLRTAGAANELHDVDVIIVGAGLSGIGAACHLQTHCPGKRILILEGRERLGGTWDLF